jgi:hypothetical protein
MNQYLMKIDKVLGSAYVISVQANKDTVWKVDANVCSDVIDELMIGRNVVSYGKILDKPTCLSVEAIGCGAAFDLHNFKLEAMKKANEVFNLLLENENSSQNLNDLIQELGFIHGKPDNFIC